MANWYAALFSRAPSKVCRAKCQAWSHWSPSPERQLKILCICIQEQTTSPFDETRGHGNFFCNSSHYSNYRKYGVSMLTLPNQCMYPCLAFWKLNPDCGHLFRPGLCFWQFSTCLPRPHRTHRGLNVREGKMAVVERKICILSIFELFT